MAKVNLYQIRHEFASRHREAFEAIWHTQAFREFCEQEMNREKRDEDLKSDFLQTPKGRQVMSRLKGLKPHEMAISWDRKLLAEKFLSLRINLTFPKERIRAEFEDILNEVHPRVKRTIPPRGAAIMELDDIKLMYRAYNLVEEFLAQGNNEHQSIHEATLKLYTKVRRPRLANPPAEDRRYQQVRRWHEKAKRIINDL
jgi:hypothetical protein